MLNQNKIISAACLFSILLFMHGCMKEDYSNCGIYLHFKYTNNSEDVDKFVDEIKVINLFVFDENKHYVGGWTHNAASGNEIRLPLDKGTYTFVAWANLSEHFQYTELKPGSTSFDEAILSLTRDAEQAVTVHPQPIFHSIANDVYVKAMGIQKQEMDFTHNVNHVSVTIDGLPDTDEPATGRALQPAPGSRFALMVTANNADLKFDNSPKVNAPFVNYTPAYGQTKKPLSGEFTLMRLHAGDNSRLKLFHQADNGVWSTLYDESLTDLIMKNPNIDFDRLSTFDIKLKLDYTYSVIGINVNGWEITVNDDGHGGIIG